MGHVLWFKSCILVYSFTLYHFHVHITYLQTELGRCKEDLDKEESKVQLNNR